MQRLCAHHFTAIVMVLILFAGPVQVFGSIRSAAMAQARRAQQEQMKQQAAEQKAMAEAEQKAAAAEAAEEQRKQDAHTKANRLRIEIPPKQQLKPNPSPRIDVEPKPSICPHS